MILRPRSFDWDHSQISSFIRLAARHQWRRTCASLSTKKCPIFDKVIWAFKSESGQTTIFCMHGGKLPPVRSFFLQRRRKQKLSELNVFLDLLFSYRLNLIFPQNLKFVILEMLIINAIWEQITSMTRIVSSRLTQRFHNEPKYIQRFQLKNKSPSNLHL